MNSPSPTQIRRRYYGKDLASAYGCDDNAPYMLSRILRQSELAVTELLIERPPGWTPDPAPITDGWMIGIQLRDRPPFEYWEEGRSLGAVPLNAGDVTIHDLRRKPTSTIDGLGHSLLWFLPQTALNAVAEEVNVPCVEDLRFDPRFGVADEVLGHLSAAIRPALRAPDQLSQLFADYVTLAFAAHVAQTYGGMQIGPRLVKGGLAPWQARRAKEMLAANLSGATALAAIADACGLSLGHFSRAFRKSTGLAPHTWLLQARVERAMMLLRQPSQPLSEIAIACGFVDQSHFTRVFVQRVGTTPGAWRRSQLG